MSASELIKLVGQKTGNKDTAGLNIEGLTVHVRLLDVKQVFGRVDVLVTPVNGAGQKWVQSDKLVKI